MSEITTFSKIIFNQGGSVSSVINNSQSKKKFWLIFSGKMFTWTVLGTEMTKQLRLFQEVKSRIFMQCYIHFARLIHKVWLFSNSAIFVECFSLPLLLPFLSSLHSSLYIYKIYHVIDNITNQFCNLYFLKHVSLR